MAMKDIAHRMKNIWESTLINIAPKIAEEKPNRNVAWVFL